MKRTNSKPAGAVAGLLLLAVMAFAPGDKELDALAVKGETLARQDALSAELRNREPNRESRRGFCIGMGAAEGQTLAGPGKDKIRTQLSKMEQTGFDRGVLFSIDRNRNADLARVGAAIAKKDPDIEAARTADTDVFFWLGFDIATGIFGDPKQGALGHTETGPGAFKIRDALGAGAQRGFNAAVKLLVKTKTAPSSGKIDPNEKVVPFGKSEDNRGVVEMLKTIKKLPYISALQVVPGERTVAISFASTQSAPPLVEFSKVPPEDKRGIKTFPFDSAAFSRFAQRTKGRYTVDLDVQQEQLDISTTYYYIVNVFNDDKNDAAHPREQVTGKFNTASQSVEIIWETIKVEDDSDDFSTGEIQWWFWVNYSPSETSDDYSRYSDYYNGDMDSGQSYSTGKTTVMHNAPDHLKLEASGADWDGPGDAGPNLFPIIGSHRPLNGPGDDGGFPRLYDVNAAKGEFDLSQYPGGHASIPFQLSSSGGSLRFVIFGRIEVNRFKQ